MPKYNVRMSITVPVENIVEAKTLEEAKHKAWAQLYDSLSLDPERNTYLLKVERAEALE